MSFSVFVNKVSVNKVNVNKVDVKVNVSKVNVKVNVNKVNDKLNDIYSIHSHYKGGGRWPPPQKRCRGTSSVVSFVVAMNGVDVVELVIDLVVVGLDVDLAEVDLDVDLVDVDLVDADLG